VAEPMSDGKAKRAASAASEDGRSDSLRPGTVDALVLAARKARANAYAPYSHFAVGAALLADDGSVHLGVNVENSAFPTSVCAERTALGTAVTAGHRRFLAIAIALERGKNGELGSPCGNCRQALSEFGLDLVVLLAGPDGDPIRFTLRELLPRAFGPDSL
jgi:cytidine deaminase